MEPHILDCLDSVYDQHLCLRHATRTALSVLIYNTIDRGNKVKKYNEYGSWHEESFFPVYATLQIH